MLFRIFTEILLLVVVVKCSNVTEYNSWADQGIQSYLLKFWNSSANYINANYPSQGVVTQYWTFAQGFDAVVDAVERTETQQYYGWINMFYNTQNNIGWFRDWYDDENWMGLALLRSYDLALSIGDTTSANLFLNTSIVLLTDIAKAWDTTCCGNIKGGVWWDRQHTQKATASNAGPVILASRLYKRTGTQQYLTWAEQWFEFWSVNMVSPSTYEIADHINSNGQIVWWKFTYNSGLMVGAATELFKTTNNATYLKLAHNYASFMLTNMTTTSTYGPVLTDGPSSSCGGDCMQFKGPSYRYLMELYETDPTNSADICTLLQASAMAIWNIARDSRTLFAVDWAEAESSSAGVADSQQNEACQALSQWAEYSGPYPGTGYPTGQYEAENGYMNGFAVSTAVAGYTGWGYIEVVGQPYSWSLYFQVNAAASYTIGFRYSGSTTVQFEISNVISTDLEFPSASSFTTAAFPKTISLNPGRYTISISSTSASGDFCLDHITIN